MRLLSTDASSEAHGPSTPASGRFDPFAPEYLANPYPLLGDLRGIAASMLDGLLYGSGDAVVGINPASDNIPALAALVDMLADVIARYEIPTQSCVLTHVTNTLRLIDAGAPVDLVFQSVAGTERANEGFGINLALLREAHDAGLSLKRGTVGNDVMYFETGQGSALSAGAHHGLDQQTCEARACGVARAKTRL